MEEIKLCEYGCGKIATIQLKGGKWDYDEDSVKKRIEEFQND